MATPTRLGHAELLALLKHAIRPRVYLEIGVEVGATLLSEPQPATVIGIDPVVRPHLKAMRRPGLSIFEMTSDDFFASVDVQRLTFGQPIDLAFVDGMHLFEFALRDVLNIERHSDRSTLICVHDVNAQTAERAARVQKPGAWMGDVYKIVPILRRHRPDLAMLLVEDIPPSGMLLITNCDPSARMEHLLPAIQQEFEDAPYDTVFPEVRKEFVPWNSEATGRFLLDVLNRTPATAKTAVAAAA